MTKVRTLKIELLAAVDVDRVKQSIDFELFIDGDDLVWFPAGYREVVRDDHAAGLHLLFKERAQTFQRLGQQIDGDQVGLREVGFEQIARLNAGQAAEIEVGNLLPARVHQFLVDLKADGSSAEIFRRRDH